MQDKIIKPEENIKTLWLIQWSIVLVAIIVIFLIMSFFFKFFAFFGVMFVICLGIFVFCWLPVQYNAISYIIKDDCIEARSGVVFKRVTSVPYQKITNIDITQDPLERMFSIGTVHVQTAGMGTYISEMLLCGIGNTEELKNTLLEKVKSSLKS